MKKETAVDPKRQFTVVISTTSKPDEKTVFTILPRFDQPKPTFGISLNGVDQLGFFTLDQEGDSITFDGMFIKGGSFQLTDEDLAAIAKEVIEKFPAWHQASYPEK